MLVEMKNTSSLVRENDIQKNRIHCSYCADLALYTFQELSHGVLDVDDQDIQVRSYLVGRMIDGVTSRGWTVGSYIGYDNLASPLPPIWYTKLQVLGYMIFWKTLIGGRTEDPSFQNESKVRYKKNSLTIIYEFLASFDMQYIIHISSPETNMCVVFIIVPVKW